MTLSGSTLAEAVAVLGIDREVLLLADRRGLEGAGGSTPLPAGDGGADTFWLSESVRGSELSGLLTEEGRRTLEALATDLKGVGFIAIKAGEQTLAGVATPEDPQSTIADFAAQLGRQQDTSYEVEIEIDRPALANKTAQENDATAPTAQVAEAPNVRVFLFGDSLVAEAAHGLSHVGRLWIDPLQPQVIAILDDGDIDVSGKLLRVVGGTKVTTADLSEPLEGADTTRTHQSRLKHIAWPRRWSGALTPEHFNLTIADGANTAVVKALTSQTAKLTLLHLCDRARVAAAEQFITADFRGGNHAADILMDDFAVDRPLKDTEIAAMAELVEWVYREPTEDARDWIFDRLQFAQVTIARLLEMAQAASTDSSQPKAEASRQSTAQFVRISVGLAARLEQQWESYVLGKLDQYAAKVSEVEAEASDAAAKYNARVAAVGKSVAEAALAAVGVMVGTFIAAAFDSPFNRDLFEIGLVVYAGYVVVFPLVLGQLSHAYQFRQVQRVHTARMTQYRSLLGASIDENPVVRVAKGAGWKFWVWWALAILVYVALVAFAIVAIEEIPDRIIKGLPVVPGT